MPSPFSSAEVLLLTNHLSQNRDTASSQQTQQLHYTISRKRRTACTLIPTDFSIHFPTAGIRISSVYSMPKAYTLTPRPQNLSTIATLIHRLRHPLRIKRTHRPSTQPSHSSSTRKNQDQHRLKARDERLDIPTSHDPPLELAEIEDKGEYTKQRYGNVESFWNSVLVETSEQNQTRRTIGHDNKRVKGKRCGFDDTEELYRAYRSRSSGQGSRSTDTGVPQQTNSHAVDPAPPGVCASSAVPTGMIIRTDEANQHVSLPQKSRLRASKLTWNKTLTTILTRLQSVSSPARTVLARSHSRSRSRSLPRSSSYSHNPSHPHRAQATEVEGEVEVDMRDVAMVPNFSYPLRSAPWYTCEWWDDGGGQGTGAGWDVGGERGSVQLGEDDDVSFLNLNGEGGGYRDEDGEVEEEAEVDSLYRAPTPRDRFLR